MRNLPATSQTWLQNFRSHVNGVRVSWSDLQLNLVAGQCVELMLEFEHSYLIGDPESPLKLCCDPDAESLGLVCDPPFEQLVEMAEGLVSLTWYIRAKETSGGPFTLHFEMPLYQEMPPSPPVPGKLITIDQDLRVFFDKFPIVFGESTAFPCFGGTHTINVKLAAGSALLGKEAKLKWIGPSPEQLKVKMIPDFGTQKLTSEGCTWTMNCNDSDVKGEWLLYVVVVDPAMESRALSMSLGDNLVTVERWSSESSLSQWPPLPQTGLTASSAFTGKLVGGVEVTVSSSSGTSYGYTDEQGKYVRTGEGISLSVYNNYDKSWV